MPDIVLGEEFYHRDALEVAPELVGKLIVRTFPDGSEAALRVTETEVYRGEEDTACHASRGMTARTSLLYGRAGILYVYLCYGMHWLMNVITGEEGVPQGVLFRACRVYDGPGKLTRALEVDKSFNGQPLFGNPRIRIEDDGYRPELERLPRVGIKYATPEYRDMPWRFADKARKSKK